MYPETFQLIEEKMQKANSGMGLPPGLAGMF